MLPDNGERKLRLSHEAIVRCRDFLVALMKDNLLFGGCVQSSALLWCHLQRG